LALNRFGKLNGVSLEQLENAILGLAPEERKRLAAWFEENPRELLGDDGDELSEQQEAEILRRRDQALAHPELLEPWDGAMERVRQRLHEFRDQETSSRLGAKQVRGLRYFMRCDFRVCRRTKARVYFGLGLALVPGRDGRLCRASHAHSGLRVVKYI
jgi:hypothetical protein